MARPGAAKMSPLERFGKLSPANKALVGLLIMGLVGVVFYLMFYSDVVEAIAKEKRQKLDLERKLSEYQVKLQNKQQFQEEIRQLEKKRQTALEKLPEKAEIPALLSKIHGQAKIVGLDIKDFARLDEICDHVKAVLAAGEWAPQIEDMPAYTSPIPELKRE